MGIINSANISGDSVVGQMSQGWIAMVPILLNVKRFIIYIFQKKKKKDLFWIVTVFVLEHKTWKTSNNFKSISIWTSSILICAITHVIYMKSLWRMNINSYSWNLKLLGTRMFSVHLLPEVWSLLKWRISTVYVFLCRIVCKTDVGSNSKVKG